MNRWGIMIRVSLLLKLLPYLFLNMVTIFQQFDVLGKGLHLYLTEIIANKLMGLIVGRMRCSDPTYGLASVLILCSGGC
jgi:hypothetical protein